ncbi:MAG TPA: hypothetical protein VK176_02095 [Phycisphaerales bacterium]|nr:hypothetical protein [Phycisphaerales bacterium]
MRRHFEALHILAAILWFTALMSAGLGAAVAFPVLKPLNPHLPDFAQFPGEHWRIAGGAIGNRLFTISDIFQLAGPIVCTLFFIPILLRERSTAAEAPRLGGITIARSVILLLACALGLYQSLILGPDMRHTIEAFWSAARAGNLDTAASLQAAFDASHPKARIIMESSALLTFLLIILGLWSRRVPCRVPCSVLL